MATQNLASLGKVPETRGFLENIAVADGSLEFEWKIPDFFLRLKECNYNVKSSQFQFLGANLIIRLTVVDMHYFIAIPCKMKDGYSDVRVEYSIEIRWSDGTVYQSVYGTMVVRPIVSFGTDKKISSRLALLRDQTKIAPKDVLTLFCRFSADKECCEKTTADSATQSEISEGIFNLVKNLQDLLTSGEDSDVVMKVGEKEFQAHRAILGARSTVFASMFRHDMKERDCGAVDITDCDPHAFEQFLLYVYTGKVDCLSAENICQLYQVADKYDIQDLKTECIEHMKKNLSTDDFCDVISLALRLKESPLIKTATQFFAKNAKKIVTTPNWLVFLKENPVEANELTIQLLNSVVPD